MAYLPNDLFVGQSLDLYGEFSQQEVDLYTRIIRKRDVVVEVGAHIGTLTIPLARLVAVHGAAGPGAVFAFEPQRILYQLLNANLALNRVRNVHAQQVAIGQKTGFLRLPEINYRKRDNFGGYSMMDAGPERVRVVTIDSLRLRRLNFLKIDAEGMETKVLMGAKRTIVRCRPIIYCENDRKKKSARLIECLKAMGYTMYWHLPALYNKNNFRHRRENVFGPSISANMLCLPPGTKFNVKGMLKVTGQVDSWEKLIALDLSAKRKDAKRGRRHPHRAASTAADEAR
jgi:FkbM family methyltransferase